MDFRELHYVLKVSEEKSFTKAAQKLFISQPALSQYILKFEEELGTALFDRTCLPLKLTYAGEQFIETAQNILFLKQQLQQKMDDISLLKRGRIVMGISPYRGKHFLPKVLPPFHRTYPGIEVILKENNASELENLILKGEIDFSVQILPLRNNKEIIYTPICNEISLVALSLQHPVNKAKNFRRKKTGAYPEIRLAELKDQNFILLKPEFPGRTLANGLFAAAGFTPKILLETSSLETAHALSVSGSGVSIVTDTLVAACPQKLRGAYYSIQDNSPVTLVLAYKKNAYLSKATLAMFALIKQLFPNNH